MSRVLTPAPTLQSTPSQSPEPHVPAPPFVLPLSTLLILVPAFLLLVALVYGIYTFGSPSSNSEHDEYPNGHASTRIRSRSHTNSSLSRITDRDEHDDDDDGNDYTEYDDDDVALATDPLLPRASRDHQSQSHTEMQQGSFRVVASQSYTRDLDDSMAPSTSEPIALRRAGAGQPPLNLHDTPYRSNQKEFLSATSPQTNGMPQSPLNPVVSPLDVPDTPASAADSDGSGWRVRPGTISSTLRGAGPNSPGPRSPSFRKDHRGGKPAKTGLYAQPDKSQPSLPPASNKDN